MAQSKQTSKSKSAVQEGKQTTSGVSRSDAPLIDANSAARAAAAMLRNRDAEFVDKSGGTVKQIKHDLARSGLASLGIVAGKGGGAAKFSNLLGGGKGSGGHHQKNRLGANRQGVPRRTSNG